MDIIANVPIPPHSKNITALFIVLGGPVVVGAVVVVVVVGISV